MAGETVTRVRLCLSLAVLATAFGGISGQSRTADGVVALARGDYQRAVEILKPLAEDWRSHDDVAQFFMAGLYETGRGLPVDPMRACALYARVAGKSDSPFAQQAFPLFAAFAPRGDQFNRECQLLANIGFDTGFEPATFDLGPGHFVEWTLTGVKVTYDGRTKSHPIELAQAGARFLPLQDTELPTGPTRAVMRHFVEAFVWSPAWKSGQWTGQWNLRWHIFEIVRDEIIQIDTPESLVTVDADAPPSREAFDVRDYAAIRVDAEGRAEWTILKGLQARSELIETDAERREAREAAAAREAALKRVDWKRRSDVNRQPEITYVDSEGCGYFQLLGWTANRDEIVVVRANMQNIPLQTGAATFDLIRNSSNLSIDVYVYDTPQSHFNFCTDVIMRQEGAIEPQTWHAIAGTVSIELSPSGGRSGPRATVTLTNVVLRTSAGAEVTMSRPVRLSAIVGAVFG